MYHKMWHKLKELSCVDVFHEQGCTMNFAKIQQIY